MNITNENYTYGSTTTTGGGGGGTENITINTNVSCCTGPSEAGGVILYLSNVVSSVAPYTYGALTPYANTTAPTQSIFYSLGGDSNPHLLGTFTTPVNVLSSNIIPGGTWSFSGYFGISNVTPPVGLYMNLV